MAAVTWKCAAGRRGPRGRLLPAALAEEVPVETDGYDRRSALGICPGSVLPRSDKTHLAHREGRHADVPVAGTHADSGGNQRMVVQRVEGFFLPREARRQGHAAL